MVIVCARTYFILEHVSVCILLLINCLLWRLNIQGVAGGPGMNGTDGQKVSLRQQSKYSTLINLFIIPI